LAGKIEGVTGGTLDQTGQKDHFEGKREEVIEENLGQKGRKDLSTGISSQTGQKDLSEGKTAHLPTHEVPQITAMSIQESPDLRIVPIPKEPGESEPGENSLMPRPNTRATPSVL
jgi:hypothetical protein